MHHGQNNQRKCQAWKSLEIREIIECDGHILEITEILECHDKSMDIYFKCVLQFDFYKETR